MRAVRSALIATIMLGLTVSTAAAQSTRGFKNSWFWGLKGGAQVYSVYSDTSGLAPLAGIDWLITRTNGGLYVSYDHSFLNQFVIVNDSVNPLDTQNGRRGRHIDINGLRRVTIAGMLFPIPAYRMQPSF